MKIPIPNYSKVIVSGSETGHGDQIGETTGYEIFSTDPSYYYYEIRLDNPKPGQSVWAYAKEDFVRLATESDQPGTKFSDN